MAELKSSAEKGQGKASAGAERLAKAEERLADLGALGTNQWNFLQEQMSRLVQAWELGDPGDLAKFLPPPDDVLRAITLQELILTDLEMRWRNGHNVSLDYYLGKYPELGTLSELPTKLIHEEYMVRKRYGDEPVLTSYKRRFPQQFSELEILIDQQPLTNPLQGPHTSPLPSSGGTGNMGNLPEMNGYKILRRLNGGAFADVFEAEAQGGVRVAIKIIRQPITNDDAKRELESLEVIRQLRHDQLVQIHAFWIYEERLCVVMDLGDCTLRERLQECKQAATPDNPIPGIPPKELFIYFRDSAEALDYLHSENVLHRDVKPANILLFRRKGIRPSKPGVNDEYQARAKLADFGLAKLLESQCLDASGGGTLAYMAPEACRNRTNAQSDLYSLAASYAELRLGRPLFPYTNMYELTRAHLEEMPNLDPLPADEQKVVLRALAKEPEDRFPTCMQFVTALEEVLPLPTTRPTRQGPMMFAGFRLARLLDNTSRGELWEAVSPEGTHVALTVIRNVPWGEANAQLRTLQFLRGLKHENLAQLFDAFMLDPHDALLTPEVPPTGNAPVTLCLTRELMPGSLAKRLDRDEKGIPLRELVGLMWQAAEGLDALRGPFPIEAPPRPAPAKKAASWWSRGKDTEPTPPETITVLHCAVSPRSLLFDGDKLKVGDFVRARLLHSTQGLLPGDDSLLHGYVAPELYEKKVHPNSDQYSLAIAYVELRTGRTPFKTTAPGALKDLQKQGKLNLKNLQDSEREVIKRATALDPAQRYPGCREMVAALEEACFTSGIRVASSRPPVSTSGKKAPATLATLAPVAPPPPPRKPPVNREDSGEIILPPRVEIQKPPEKPAREPDTDRKPVNVSGTIKNEVVNLLSKEEKGVDDRLLETIMPPRQEEAKPTPPAPKPPAPKSDQAPQEEAKPKPPAPKPPASKPDKGDEESILNTIAPSRQKEAKPTPPAPVEKPREPKSTAVEDKIQAARTPEKPRSGTYQPLRKKQTPSTGKKLAVTVAVLVALIGGGGGGIYWVATHEPGGSITPVPTPDSNPPKPVVIEPTPPSVDVAVRLDAAKKALLEDKLTEALKLYGEIDTPSERQEDRDLARLGKARVLARQGKGIEVREIVQHKLRLPKDLRPIQEALVVLFVPDSATNQLGRLIDLKNTNLVDASWEREELDKFGKLLSTKQTEVLGRMAYVDDAQELASYLTKYQPENTTAVAHERALAVIMNLRRPSPVVPKGSLEWLKDLAGSNQRLTEVCQDAARVAEQGRVLSSQASRFLNDAAPMLPPAFKSYVAYAGARLAKDNDELGKAAKRLDEVYSAEKEVPAFLADAKRKVWVADLYAEAAKNERTLGTIANPYQKTDKAKQAWEWLGSALRLRTELASQETFRKEWVLATCFRLEDKDAAARPAAEALQARQWSSELMKAILSGLGKRQLSNDDLALLFAHAKAHESVEPASAVRSYAEVVRVLTKDASGVNSQLPAVVKPALETVKSIKEDAKDRPQQAMAEIYSAHGKLREKDAPKEAVESYDQAALLDKTVARVTTRINAHLGSVSKYELVDTDKKIYQLVPKPKSLPADIRKDATWLVDREKKSLLHYRLLARVIYHEAVNTSDEDEVKKLKLLTEFRQACDEVWKADVNASEASELRDYYLDGTNTRFEIATPHVKNTGVVNQQQGALDWAAKIKQVDPVMSAQVSALTHQSQKDFLKEKKAYEAGLGRMTRKGDSFHLILRTNYVVLLTEPSKLGGSEKDKPTAKDLKKQANDLLLLVAEDPLYTLT